MTPSVLRTARHAFGFAALVILPQDAFSANIIAPNNVADSDSLATGSPFNLSSISSSSARYQQVFAASEFLSAIPEGGLITQIVFRPAQGVGQAFSSVLPNIQIDLSTTSKVPDGLSTLFADNIGADNSTVFDVGALALSSAFTGPFGGRKDFDIAITFPTPFFYNPSLGNLLLDVRNFGAGTTTWFAAVNALGDSTSRVTTGNSPNAVNNPTAAVTDSSGLVTKFTVVPEPTIAWLAAFGLASKLLRRTRNEPVR